MSFSIELMSALLAVVAVTAVAVLVFAHFAEPMKLLAHPGGHRLHSAPTPMVGGLAIYLGILTGFVLVENSFAGLMPSLLMLCLVGVFDDRYSLPAWSRFLAQGIAAYVMVKLTGVQLNTLGYLTPNGEVLLGRWSLPMTLFAVIGVINAVNMSDGHDGLAASLVVAVLIGLLLCRADTSLILVGVAAVFGFLMFNLRLWRPQATVFMGDAGSTMLGLLLAYLLIQHSQFDAGISPVTALWLLALPLMDAVSVLIVRPLRGKSPFDADRIHYHHQLIDRGLGVNVAVLIALVVQSGFIAFGLWAWRENIAEYVQLSVFLTLFAAYLLSLMWFTRKQNKA